MPVRRKTAAPALVVRVTEANGDSPKSWDAAIAAAVKASDVKAPLGVEVSRMWAEWGSGRLSRYHVTVRVAYRQTLKTAAKS
ncbi:MAG TPA: dodecin domain-containing protein [Methylomirabilota bacterium]|nr:dodecin domain-containing protein [Methylomirabilota bacterium]